MHHSKQLTLDQLQYRIDKTSKAFEDFDIELAMDCP